MSYFKQAAIGATSLNGLIDKGIAYAILDAAANPGIERAMLVKQNAENGMSLFKGTLYSSNQSSAPYLVRLDSTLFHWIEEKLADQPWGVIAFSHSTYHALFQNFRRVLISDFPDGRTAVFRFYDPRVLPVFLASQDAPASGIWNGISAFCWRNGTEFAIAQPTANDLTNHAKRNDEKLLPSADLERSLAKNQQADFAKRCEAYFEDLDVDLPAPSNSSMASILKMAASYGIAAEIDVIRFAHLLLAWKQVRSMPAVRQILAYPQLPGSDRVDLLCELAAFSGTPPRDGNLPGLDPRAVEQAHTQFLARHEKDRRFQRIHPDGRITMELEDGRWRKEWMSLYKQHVSSYAKMSRVEVGAIVAS